jgi:NAD(P)-dependent dehydrogenase (short-subunit alcohol dehydrogenase family)
MVSLKEVRANNATLKERFTGPVFVFLGATAGIGEATLKTLVANTTSPKAYIIGRSRTHSQPLLDSLKESNPSAELNFLETEISLIANVDKVSAIIAEKEQKVDLLIMSPGYLTFAGLEPTSEGIDRLLSLRYYARIRTIENLLPLLKAAPSPRVLSILAGGLEGSTDFDDLDLQKNYSFTKAADQSGTMSTLALEELAKTNPEVSFIHQYPGIVNSELLDKFLGGTPGLLGYLTTFLSWTIVPILKLFTKSVEESGERHAFSATSERYPSKKTIEEKDLKDGSYAKGSAEGGKNGVYRLNGVGEAVVDDKILGPYRADGKGQVLMEHTQAVFERALGRA